MPKILIVDDETPIREWIAFCISKRSEQYEIVGLASNGEEALEMFNSYVPDIVFTDIKMPIMDGLELMKQIRLIKPFTEIVVLTCYSDFEYARQAVKYGVTEYILKTEVSDKNIMGILDKIEKKRADVYENNEKALSEIQLKREAFLRYVIMQKGSSTDISEKILQEQNIFLKGNSLFAMAVKNIDNHEFIDQIDSYSGLLQNDKINNLIWFSYDKDIFVFLGNIKATPSYLIQLNSLKDFALSMNRNIKCTIGLSQIYQDLGYLGAAINEAVQQVRLEFYHGKGSVILTNATKKNPEFLQQLDFFKNQMFEALNRGETNQALDLNNRILAFIEEWEISDVDYIKKVCIEIIEFVYNRAANNRIMGVSPINCIKDEIANIELFLDIKKLLRKKVEEIIGDKAQNLNGYSHYILKALDYINNHYSEPIGLTAVASSVNLNPEYFCRLFKENTGKNFNNYLAEVRLKKAVYLLKNTDMKVNEIAQAVGYPNLSYFSTIFKKYLGVSPFDYRNKFIN